MFEKESAIVKVDTSLENRKSSMLQFAAQTWLVFLQGR